MFPSLFAPVSKSFDFPDELLRTVLLSWTAGLPGGEAAAGSQTGAAASLTCTTRCHNNRIY